MEPLPATHVGLADDTRDLEIEAVVIRRLVGRVDLQVLGNRMDILAERLDERGVRGLRREDAARKQDHADCADASLSRGSAEPA